MAPLPDTFSGFSDDTRDPNWYDQRAFPLSILCQWLRIGKVRRLMMSWGGVGQCPTRTGVYCSPVRALHLALPSPMSDCRGRLRISHLLLVDTKAHVGENSVLATGV